jgi:hypothetical protein
MFFHAHIFQNSKSEVLTVSIFKTKENLLPQDEIVLDVHSGMIITVPGGILDTPL